MKKKKSETVIDWILPLSFISIVLVIFSLNIKIFYHQVKEGKVNREEIENTYKSDFYDKEKFSNLYGISLDLLNKKVVGNFEYVKDNSGFMHSIALANCDGDSAEQFLGNMVTLKEDLQIRGIPLVYLQIPSRELDGYSDYPSEVFNKTAQVIEQLVMKLEEEEINTLNIGEYCLIAEESMLQSQFFFKTDLHLTTDAEMRVGKYVTDFLNMNTKCEIRKDIFDVNQYKKESYSFRGNFVKESGRYFIEDDTFDMYFPSCDTSMALDNRVQGVERKGEFEEVVMNVCGEGEERYEVISYLQYTSPYYEITNYRQGKNNILMIMDSMCFRTVSYLTLGCHKVTILDPRFFNGIDWIKTALQSENFDAVIVCHQSSLFGYDFYPENTVKEELNSMESVNGVNMCSLDFCNGAWTENTNILNMDTTQPYLELSGWAADLQTELPAKDVYMAAGSHVIKCEYGFESKALRDYFNNENYSECGFSIKIPTVLLMEEDIDSIQLWVVSADGNLVYKSLDYTLNWEH